MFKKLPALFEKSKSVTVERRAENGAPACFRWHGWEGQAAPSAVVISGDRCPINSPGQGSPA
jgi:hypothetical protein